MNVTNAELNIAYNTGFILNESLLSMAQNYAIIETLARDGASLSKDRKIELLRGCLKSILDINDSESVILNIDEMSKGDLS